MGEIKAGKCPEMPWPSFPIPEEWKEKGNPEGTGMVLVESEETGLAAGHWRCTPGQYHWHYDDDEIVCILEGEVIVTDEQGRSVTLHEGDMAFFPRGSRPTWNITKPLRKIFFLSNK